MSSEDRLVATTALIMTAMVIAMCGVQICDGQPSDDCYKECFPLEAIDDRGRCECIGLEDDFL